MGILYNRVRDFCQFANFNINARDVMMMMVFSSSLAQSQGVDGIQMGSSMNSIRPIRDRCDIKMANCIFQYDKVEWVKRFFLLYIVKQTK